MSVIHEAAAALRANEPPAAFTAFPSYEKWCAFRIGLHTNRSEYDSQKALAARHATYTECVACKKGFSDANVRTMDGWLETQISGMCEDCFDECSAEVAEYGE